MKLRNLLVAGTATLISAVALAEGSVTVEKVQGSKAIVKFEGMSPKAGESYDLGGGGGGGGGNGSRAMYLQLNSNIFSKTFGAGAPMGFSLVGTPGWNMGQFEVGVPISFVWAKTTGSVMAMSGGIKPEYNFSENNAGTMMIPYVGALFTFEFDHTSLANTKSMAFGGEFGLKYFLNDQVAVVAALNFSMAKIMGVAGMGKVIGVPVGIRAYF